MPQIREKPSTGFRKGFLLSSSSKQSKKKQAHAVVKPKPKQDNKTSSALLDLEEDKSPLLFVADHDETSTETEAETQTKPLHVLISEQYNDSDVSTDGFGLTAVSTRRKSPLITEGPTNDSRITEVSEKDSVSVRQRKEEKSPLLWEVPSPLEAPSRPNTDPVEDSNATIMNPENLLSTKGRIAEKATSLEPNPQLSHELPNLLWKLKQAKQEEQTIVEQFVTNQVQSDADWKIMWAFVLNGIAEDTSSRRTSPSVQLGISLLETKNGLESFVIFLDINDDKQSRVLALGGAILIHRFCAGIRKTNCAVSNVAWLTQVVPSLSKIVFASPTKRSVLSQQSITAAYDIVALASTQKNGIATLDLESNLWDALATINDLLQVQQGWVENSFKAKSATMDTYSVDASRRKCTLAVIHDWRVIIKEALRLHEGVQVEGGGGPEDLTNLTEYTCLQLAGDTTVSDGLGSLHQTLSDDPTKLCADAIVECMQIGTQLVQSIREKQESQEVQSWQRERVRAILRGVAAWLGQSKKHLQALTKKPATEDATSGCTYLRQVTDLCIQLLRCDTDSAVDLDLSVLGYLWSSSNGLPPDFVVDDSSGSSTDVPASFELLLDELRIGNSNDAEHVDPTERALCTLVSRCIQYRGPSLLNELVKRNGIRPSTVDILENILSEAKTSSCKNGSACDTNDHGSLLRSTGDLFMDCLGSNQYAQRKLQSSPRLLCVLPIKTVIPRLIAIANEKISDTGVVTVVAAALTQELVSSIPDEVEDAIQSVIESVGQCDDEQHSDNENTNNEGGLDTLRSSKLVRKITAPWRRTLLESPACGIGGLADVLSAIANGMFADPSSSVPLALLGTVVGDELSLTTDSDEIQAARVHLAVRTLVRTSLAELEKADRIQEDEKNGIYFRLSPLLLLRRIPYGYYTVAWNTAIDDREEMGHLFSQLADQLSFRLGTPPLSASKKHVAFTAEERRLAAEIAGRCLPFDDSDYSSCSCYQRICFPSFSSALRCLASIVDEQEASPTSDLLRAARAALYACCHHVPIAQDNEPGQCLFGILSFVLTILNVDITQACGGDRIIDEDGVIQLQTGCIEFVAVCLESTLQLHINTKQVKQSEPVIEIDMPSTSMDDDGTKQGQVGTKEALGTSCSAIASLLRTGSTIPCQLRLRANGFVPESSKDASHELSVSARTCLWNAFVVVSQRCPDDGRLSTWANLTAQWVLKWVSLGPVDDNLRHPLCMAAALQVIFILITRTKSFDCLDGGKRNAASVHKAYKVAVVSIKTETNIGGDYARIAMRKSALKLLLALVTIDQMDNSKSFSSCLSPGELGETFTLLNGTANVDSDSEVRMLATHILAGMRAS